MLHKLLKCFGYRLVRIDEEPQSVVRAFADEIEGILITDNTFSNWRSPDYKSTLDVDSENLYYAIANKFSPETVREEGAKVAAGIMVLLYHYGELLPEKRNAS